MGENQYVAAQIDEDSPLYQEFAVYEDTEGFESRSEAVRSLLRQGLKNETTHPLDERPDSTLAGWLWKARQDIHMFVLVAVVSLLVSTLTASAVIAVGAQLLALAYALAVLLVAVDTVLLGDRITLRLMDISERVNVEVDT